MVTIRSLEPGVVSRKISGANILSCNHHNNNYVYMLLTLTLSAQMTILRFRANNIDSGGTARDDLSHLKSALFAFKL